MHPVQPFRRLLKSSLLALPLLLAACAYDGGYGSAYYDYPGDAYFYSCFHCGFRHGPYRYHHLYGHGGYWHGGHGYTGGHASGSAPLGMIGSHR